MLQRLKRIIKLSNKDPKAIDALTDEQVEALPNLGDGNAVFFGDGTQEEFDELERENKGLKGIFGL